MKSHDKELFRVRHGDGKLILSAVLCISDFGLTSECLRIKTVLDISDSKIDNNLSVSHVIHSCSGIFLAAAPVHH